MHPVSHPGNWYDTCMNYSENAQNLCGAGNIGLSSDKARLGQPTVFVFDPERQCPVASCKRLPCILQNIQTAWLHTCCSGHQAYT